MVGNCSQRFRTQLRQNGITGPQAIGDDRTNQTSFGPMRQEEVCQMIHVAASIATR
jgi:hypothetical protein